MGAVYGSPSFAVVLRLGHFADPLLLPVFAYPRFRPRFDFGLGFDPPPSLSLSYRSDLFARLTFCCSSMGLKP